jgi:diaminopimelate decarboxylase
MNEALRAVAREFGTPCYVYFFDQVRERIAAVRTAFGNRFRLSYAVKSNPNPGLLRRLQGLVDGLDVSSGGEVRGALASGWQADQLGFTGPGKTAEELRQAVECGIGEVIVESLDEAALLNCVAQQASRRQPVLVRIATSKVPRGFGVNMSGKPTQFGIDEEELDPAVEAIQGMQNLELSGFHSYSGTQCLKAEALSENYEIFADIFRHVCQRHGLQPRRLIFGAGIGVPYYENDVPVELAAITARTNPVMDALKAEARFAQTECVLESGRYLVGEAGIFLTGVTRVKQSRGTTIGICDGGMNHHLAAAGHLGTVVQRNYQMVKVTEDVGPEGSYTLVGPLCTTIDTLGRQVRLHGLAAGDVIGIKCSGAYGLTASPLHFISHTPPKEVIVETVNGRVRFEDCSVFRNS